MVFLSSRHLQRLPCLGVILAICATSVAATAQEITKGTPAAPDSYEAQVVASFPPYHPEQAVTGVLRIWGHGKLTLPWMRHLVTLWEERLER